MDNTLDTSQTAVDATITTAATKAMSGGGIATLMGYLASNEAVAALGILLTIAGFGINLFFQIRRDRREQALHAAELKVLEDKNEKKIGF